MVKGGTVHMAVSEETMKNLNGLFLLREINQFVCASNPCPPDGKPDLKWQVVVDQPSWDRIRNRLV
jgi:hypothetical protein